MTKQMWIDVGLNTLVIGLAVCIFVGAFMGLYTGNPSWLWLCTPLVIFLS